MGEQQLVLIKRNACETSEVPPFLSCVVTKGLRFFSRCPQLVRPLWPSYWPEAILFSVLSFKKCSFGFLLGFLSLVGF